MHSGFSNNKQSAIFLNPRKPYGLIWELNWCTIKHTRDALKRINVSTIQLQYVVLCGGGGAVGSSSGSSSTMTVISK